MNKKEFKGCKREYDYAVARDTISNKAAWFENNANNLIVTLESAWRQLEENEVRFRIAGDGIAKLHETISDYQSMLTEAK